MAPGELEFLNELDQCERWLNTVPNGRAQAQALRTARIGVSLSGMPFWTALNEAGKVRESLRYARRLPNWGLWWNRLNEAIELARMTQ